MARKHTGTISRSKKTGTLRVRVTVTDDKGVTRRPWLRLSKDFDDAAALRVAARTAAAMQGKPYKATLIRYSRKATGLTVDQYVNDLWMPARLGKVKSIRSDRSRWRLHVSPLIGSRLITEVTADHLRDVVQELDRKAVQLATLKGRKRFGPKSAKNVWALVTKMFRDAVGSKVRQLRVLERNPAEGVEAPDAPSEIEKQWLFPSELHQLLACPAVPLQWRRLYAASVYCYCRPGEALGLLWGRSVDLEHGMVRINRAYDHIAKVFHEHTKTKDSRHFSVEPVLRPMFAAMWAQYPRQGLVFDTVGKLAETLRGHLMTAGVTRAALHVARPGALRVRFHDLRATGITYMAIRGDSDNAVRERAGHADFETTLGYVRRGAQAAGGTGGDPFAALPDELLGIVPVSSPTPSDTPTLEHNSRENRGAGEGIRNLIQGHGDGSLPQTPGEAPEGIDATGGPRGRTRPGEDPGDDSGDDSFPRFPGVAKLAADLHTLAEIDPAGARPGLAVIAGLDAALKGDERTVREVLREEARAAHPALPAPSLPLTGAGR